MGRAWSVFATPATELPKAFRAAVELDLNGGVLCLGPALSPRGAEAIWVAFAIEQGGDHFVEAVRSHDLPYSFFSTFSRLVTMYGTSNTDDLEIRWFQDGHETDLRLTDFTGVGGPRNVCDLGELREWASFGFSGEPFRGDRYPLNKPEPTFSPDNFQASPMRSPLPAGTDLATLEERAKSNNPEDVVRLGLALLHTEDLARGKVLLDDYLAELEEGSELQQEAARALEESGYYDVYE
ncbi:MAG: hypothetical protein KC621_13470 [Myxococcales bacterium]|nr:hypothetical protein [Myxococcales bacterium]